MTAFTTDKTIPILDAHRQWSEATFGPTRDAGMRREGLRRHLIEELREIALTPDDFVEYADVFILAMDLAWRVDRAHSATTAVELIEALLARRLPLAPRSVERELINHEVPRGVDLMAWAVRAAADRGLSGEGFLATVSRKMVVNAARVWPAKINEGDPINHDRAA